jgi:hypothetical protein
MIKWRGGNLGGVEEINTQNVETEGAEPNWAYV